MQTETTQIRTLTPAGLEAFLAYFDKIDVRTGEKVSIRREAPPTHLLYDDRYSIPLPFDAEVAVSQPSSKIELARRVIDGLGEQFDAYLTDRHLWAWLTLLWSSVVLPYSEDKQGWELGELAQYDIGEAKGEKTNYYVYRHRVWGPSVLFKQLGMLSRSMLTGQIHQLGEEVDVLMFRNIATAPVLKAYDLMYFDTEARKIISSGSNKNRQVGDLRSGNVRDFADQVCQIARTYSIARISPEHLISLLPRAEFGARIDHAMSRLRIGDLPPGVPAKAA